MKIPVAISLAIAAYLVASVSLFGGNSPIGFVLFAPANRIGLPHWKELSTLIVAVVALILLMSTTAQRITLIVRLPVFVALSLILPTLLVGAYADRYRSELIREFDADHLIEHSFFRSIREAPTDFAQFYLHAVALKECVPYAWSYREMAFYRLRPNVAINVVPRNWREMCGLKFEP